MALSRTRVFISYTHDSTEHVERVLGLANRLRSEGIECHVDQYENPPPPSWAQWMLQQIDASDYVVLVCTEPYARRFKGSETPGVGLGAQWEGSIVIQEIYESATAAKFVPIVLDSEDVAHIPLVLRRSQYYVLDREPEYDKLYRRLTGQPLVQPPRLGKVRLLAMFEGHTSFGKLLPYNWTERVGSRMLLPLVAAVLLLITGLVAAMTFTGDGTPDVPAAQAVEVRQATRPPPAPEQSDSREVPPLPMSGNCLQMVSDEGDYIGAGQVWTYTDQDSEFQVQPLRNASGVSVRVDGPDGDHWTLEFSAPKRVDLAEGRYQNAARHPFQGPKQPGLSVHGNGRGANKLKGTFDVVGLEFDDSGELAGFEARFVQYGEAVTLSGPALRGVVRWRVAD